MKSSAARTKYSRDIVALTGSVLGLLASLLDWFVLKPNRLALGTGLNIAEALGWHYTIIIACLWFLCVFLSLVEKTHKRGILLAVVANIIIILSAIILMLGSSQAVTGEMPRVSLGIGVWLTCLAVYMLLFTVGQRGTPGSFLKKVVAWPGLILFAVFLLSGFLDNLSILQEYMAQQERFIQEVAHHVFLVCISVVIGIVLGILLGIWAVRNRRAEKPVFYFANIMQTIPSLALFGLLIAPLSTLSQNYPLLRQIGISGIGDAPAIIALIIYSLLPIVRNTYTGINQIDRSIIDAGLGMGMSRWQILHKIEIPLAAPVVLGGVRIAVVQSVGLAAVAALIGAGGLGWFIFQGLGQAAPDMILLGAIPIILMAILADILMRAIIRISSPLKYTGVSA